MNTKNIITITGCVIAVMAVGFGGTYMLMNAKKPDANMAANTAPVTVPVATPANTALPPSSPIKDSHPLQTDVDNVQTQDQVTENTELEHPKVKTKKKRSKKDIDKCVDQKAQQYRDEMGDPDKPINFDMINEFEKNCRKGK